MQDHRQLAGQRNALLMILATVLEPIPACATPRSARLMAAQAGEELALLIRDVRRLKSASTTEASGVH